MYRVMCSTISIAAVLGLLAVGCGGDDTTKTAIKGGAGTGGILTGKGGATGGAAGAAATGNTVGTGGTQITPVPCGNGVIDDGEKCDGDNLNSETCATLGLGGEADVLTCLADCTDFSTDLCVPSETPVYGDDAAASDSDI
jgi:hypothetical protein